MNRAILLQRTPPDRNDLIKIGKGIGDKTCQKLTDHLIPDLADGYLEVYNAQEKEYFGLRDFYSLVSHTILRSNLNASPSGQDDFLGGEKEE